MSGIWMHTKNMITKSFIMIEKEDNMKNYIFSKEWFIKAGIRALKTIAQTAIATIGTTMLFNEVNWIVVGSASLLAGILSLLTSIAGLPELEEEIDNG